MRYISNQFKLVLAFSGLFCLLMAIAVSNTVSADESGTVAKTISHSPTDEVIAAAVSSSELSSELNNEYLSPEFITDFTFNGVGLTWSGSESAQAEFYIRVDGGNWIALTMIGDEAKDKAEKFTTFPVFVSGNSLQYKIVGDSQYVQNVQLVYFDSTRAPEVSPLTTIQSGWRNVTGKNEPNIISREEWGADESYRFWEPEYTTPSTFIIHHTAGGDGGSNPAATIRGIYYWHAVVLGWGDIGYNYLIDQQGNIYEGRYSGSNVTNTTSVIGAHTYNTIDDKNYNQYSIGISILGCFENGEDCSTTHEFTSEIESSLVSLLSSLADTYNIAPKGHATLFGERQKNILGHRDLDYTLCPGNIIHDDLKTLRKKVQQAYTEAQAKNQTVYKGSIVSSTIQNTYTAGDVSETSVTYTNTGNKPWKTDDVVMQVRVIDTRHRQQVKLPTAAQANAETTLTFTWSALPVKPGTYTVSTRLYRAGKPIRGTKATQQISITNPYSVEIKKSTFPLAILTGWIPSVRLKITNTGANDLPQNTAIILNGESVTTIDTAIAVGTTSAITYSATPLSTLQTGTHSIVEYLAVNGVPVAGSRSQYTLRVD